MRILLGSVLSAVARATANPASAQILDLNTVKCQEWIESGKESIAITMAWLDGYY